MSMKDHFRGTLVGAMAGDALGMPVEGWPRQALEGAEIRELLEARLGSGTYTDDAQMMIALAEALLEAGLDLNTVARRFAENYDPRRGYGGNVHRILSAIREGGQWEPVVRRFLLPGGSYANGAAMRVAPVALAFYPDRKRVADAAEQQARVTGHTHPEGRFGARLQALGVLEALRSAEMSEAFPARRFLAELREGAPGEYRPRLEWIAAHPDAGAGPAVAALGNSGRAAESVPAALWAFLSRLDSAEEAIIRAVNLGGDTDTIGAMTGALAGAYHGLQRLPERWVRGLENGEKGRNYAIGLADRLFEWAPGRVTQPGSG